MSDFLHYICNFFFCAPQFAIFILILRKILGVERNGKPNVFFMDKTNISDIDILYKESLDFLFAQLPMFSRIGAAAYKPGLQTSLDLDDYFGNPHRSFKSIHVGGTNGKGSTSHMLASILQTAGYKVGLYTSPHLADFRERIRINGQMMSKDGVIDFVKRWCSCGYEGHPSFFELTMMMAFDYFAREHVDYAVIEVGMGGRLDSTNIITPIGCVITNISPDHMQFLGDTLEKIAGEKAGIIKHGIPVVIGNSDGGASEKIGSQTVNGVKRVFMERASEVGAPIDFARENTLLERAIVNDEGTISGYSELCGEFTSPLGGEYQKENINTVLHAVEMLRNQGLSISRQDIKEGLENVVKSTGLAGRWMITDRTPFTVCDTGHNPAGLEFTTSQLRRLMEHRPEGAKLRMVIGFVSDKDVDHISHLLPGDAKYYVTKASVPRAMDAGNLLEILEGLGLDCELHAEGVAGAFEAAKADACADDIIYVGGSTFVVADYLATTFAIEG